MWRGAETYSDRGVVHRRLGVLAVHAARGELTGVPAAAADHGLAGSLDRTDQLPHVPRHVVDAHRAARARMCANLVGAERERLAPVGDIDVGVVGCERGTRWKSPAVGAARGALPLVLVAQPRTGQALGAIEP